MIDLFSDTRIAVVAQLYFSQLGYAFIVLLVLFVLFEVILPIFLGEQSRIKKNIPDFFRYQISISFFMVTFAIIISVLFYVFGVKKGAIDITHLSFFSQVVILYFCAELVIYLVHLIAHKYTVPMLSKAHMVHHTVTTDMDWVNSRKEHLFILSLFTIVYCVFFSWVFEVSRTATITATALFVVLGALSHYRIPLTVKYFDQVFLFPKDHLRHHTAPSGPYGVTLSIFDTIFDTRDDGKPRLS